MPYFTDGKTAFVKVKLEIPSVEITCETTLPIMDFKNQSIPIEKITMNDVNKSLKRCMVKCKDADKLNQLKADLDNLKAEDFKTEKKGK